MEKLQNFWNNYKGAIIGVIIYGGISYKMGLLDEVLEKNILNKITEVQHVARKKLGEVNK